MKKADKKTTIYDLAKALGTSPSTVSAALNGTWKSRRISEKKALQIQDAAREQGYYINMQARGLRSAKSGMVGMLVPQHNSRFFASMAQEFDHCAKARNLCPVVIATERETADELKTVETLISFSVDALFTAGATNRMPSVTFASRLRFPISISTCPAQKPLLSLPTTTAEQPGWSRRCTNARQKPAYTAMALFLLAVTPRTTQQVNGSGVFTMPSKTCLPAIARFMPKLPA